MRGRFYHFLCNLLSDCRVSFAEAVLRAFNTDWHMMFGTD